MSNTHSSRRWLGWALRAQQHRTQQQRQAHVQAVAQTEAAQTLQHQQEAEHMDLMTAWRNQREVVWQGAMLDHAFQRYAVQQQVQLLQTRQAVAHEEEALEHSRRTLQAHYGTQQAYEHLTERLAQQAAAQQVRVDERHERDQGPSPTQRQFCGRREAPGERG